MPLTVSAPADAVGGTSIGCIPHTLAAGVIDPESSTLLPETFTVPPLEPGVALPWIDTFCDRSMSALLPI